MEICWFRPLHRGLLLRDDGWPGPKLPRCFKEQFRPLPYRRSAPGFAAPEESIELEVAERIDYPLLRIPLVPEFGVVSGQRQITYCVQPFGLDSSGVLAECLFPLGAQGLRQYVLDRCVGEHYTLVMPKLLLDALQDHLANAATVDWRSEPTLKELGVCGPAAVLALARKSRRQPRRGAIRNRLGVSQ